MERIEAIIRKGTSSLNQSLNSIANTDTMNLIRELTKDVVDAKINGKKVIFTGIGKNVYAAQKLAASFSSLGIPSFFMDAVHAVHGDLGILNPGDILICQSKSGNTAELINTLQHIDNNKEHFNVTVWGIDCSQKHNFFDLYCDKVIHLHIGEELDPHNMVPTISALTIQMVGDIVGVAASQDLKFTQAHFGINHPGGSIGKTINK